MSPNGTPINWTLEQLRTIWEHDGSDGKTPKDWAIEWGIAQGSWYSMKGRLRDAGGPDELYAQMQVAKKNRFNAAGAPRARMGGKTADTVEVALGRTYRMRVSASGRGGSTAQYTVTIPPSVAAPLVDLYGYEFVWEPREDGLLLKPVPKVQPPELPSWLTNGASA